MARPLKNILIHKITGKLFNNIMKFSQAFMDEIRARVRLSEYVGRAIPIRRAGREYHALCPFHKEKSPSFTVNDEKGFFHCFGCGAGGNVYTFLMRLTGAAFPEIVRDLGRKVGVDVPESTGGYSTEARTQLGRLERLNAAAGAWYRRMLTEGLAGAQAALAARESADREQARERTRLTALLGQADVVVCALPLTEATEGLLDEHAFAAMPQGGYVVNVARGAHLVDEDLLAAIDSRLARFVREGAAGAIKFGEFVRLQQHRNCFQR